MTPNIQFSIPNSSGGSAIVHPITPSLLQAILENPSSKYSKLADIVSTALSSNTSSPTSIRTISLPKTDPNAFLVLIDFLQSGQYVYSPTSNEFRDRDGGVKSVKRDDVRKLFQHLAVDWPWEAWTPTVPEYNRSKEDYASAEVYQAYREQIDEELFTVLTISDSPPTTCGNQLHHSEKRNSACSPSSTCDSVPPPSYEHSMSTSSSHPPKSHHNNEKSLATPGILTDFKGTLSQSLESRLTTLLLSHINPAVQTQAYQGMFKGTFILLAQSPKSASSNTNPKDDEIITSFEKRSEYRKIIHLPSPTSTDPRAGFSLSFITQPYVLEEIKQALARALGGKAVSSKPVTAATTSAVVAIAPEKEKKEKKGWFRRSSNSKARETKAPPVASVDSNIMEKGAVTVDTAIEDVWIRRETEMGLFETEHTKGVVLWVELIV